MLVTVLGCWRCYISVTLYLLTLHTQKANMMASSWTAATPTTVPMTMLRFSWTFRRFRFGNLVFQVSASAVEFQIWENHRCLLVAAAVTLLQKWPNFRSRTGEISDVRNFVHPRPASLHLCCQIQAWREIPVPSKELFVTLKNLSPKMEVLVVGTQIVSGCFHVLS